MDDFYSHINKEWFNKFKLPDDQVRYSSFDSVSHNVKKELMIILEIEEEKGTILGQMFGKLKNGNVNISEFEKYFKIIDKIDTMDDFMKTCGTFAIFGVSLFFHINIGRDLKHSNDHIVTFHQSNCTLPSTSYYSTYKKEYLNFLQIFCNELGINDDELFDLENEMVQNLMSLNEKRNVEKRYNILSWNDFSKEFNDINIKSFLEPFKNIKDIHINQILVDDVTYISKISNILSKTKISVLKNYLKYKFILSFHELSLPKNISRILFNFFKKELLGVERERSQNDLLISYIDSYMPEQLGQLYLDKFFTREIKTYVSNMTDLIKLSAKNVINKSSYLSYRTKELCVIKIEKMNVKIGGPSKIEDYSEFKKFVKEDIVNMTIFSEIFYTKDNILKYGTLVDREKWSMSSYSVNAYYSPLNNEIVIPAAILNKPFFSIDNDLYSNLGAIGSVISHEISHGFDDQGRLFDSDGNYRSWWNDEDIKKYNEVIREIKKQFESVSILKVKVSGDITMGENIADFTGMTILTNILNINNSLNKDYIIMYTSYARLWKQKIRDKEMIRRLKTDVHAPPRLRTNIILSNIDDFHRVFSITSKHKMFIEKEKRFKLWK
jgi:predicted metalloendopeptidase